MSGCYGNSPEDRYFENRLSEMDDNLHCPECGWRGDVDDIEWLEEEECYICPNCNHKIK
jgi:DNA-directed RNA polymerase subunit RPC12/RpoP